MVLVSPLEMTVQPFTVAATALGARITVPGFLSLSTTAGAM